MNYMCRMVAFAFVGFALLSGPTLAKPAAKKSTGALTFTGTFTTSDKSSTRGYPKEVVMQPTFLSQKLSNGRIRFLVSNQGGCIHNDHLANLESTAELSGNIANFKKDSYDLKIEFRPGEVVLSETGNPMDAEFGVGAGVSGTYKLKSSSIPDFKKAEAQFGLGEFEE